MAINLRKILFKTISSI